MWAGSEVGRRGCLIPPHTLIFRHVQNITTHTLGYGPRKSATPSWGREKGQAIESHRQGLLPILCHFKRGFTNTSIHHPMNCTSASPGPSPGEDRVKVNTKEVQSFSTCSKVQCIHSHVEVPYLQKYLIVLERGKECNREVKKQNDM